MMDRLIKTLDDTKISCGKKWSYKENEYTNGDGIKLKLQKIDQFLNNP